MKAITVGEMRSLEESAMQDGWSEEALMDAACERLARAISRAFPAPGTIVAYAGKGHNAGDAFFALRVLRDRFRWKIAIRAAFPMEQWAPLTWRKFEELAAEAPLPSPPDWDLADRPLVLLDALVGIGAKGALRSPLLELAGEMNALRQDAGARIAALDVPSGVDPDSGIIQPGAVTADLTFMIGAPKRGLLRGHAADATGALHLVHVPVLTPPADGDLRLISPHSIPSACDPRPFDFHKGKAGRVGILAGSREYSGAAILAASGALAGGAGLVTLHLPAEVLPLVAGRLPPEIIVRTCQDPGEILEPAYDALVIGCGLHSTDEGFRDALRAAIRRSTLPTVLDAEALNLLSGEDLARLGENHLLTPHPGEFRRLAPDLSDAAREEAAHAFADRTSSTLLLKGCRTVVTRKGAPLWINPTGNPGMATGGQGDLLSGVLGALLAIGNPPLEAAAIGAWVCGRAAERALLEPEVSPQSLLPTDVRRHLGGAFRDWAERAR